MTEQMHYATYGRRRPNNGRRTSAVSRDSRTQRSSFSSRSRQESCSKSVARSVSKDERRNLSPNERKRIEPQSRRDAPSRAEDGERRRSKSRDPPAVYSVPHRGDMSEDRKRRERQASKPTSSDTSRRTPPPPPPAPARRKSSPNLSQQKESPSTASRSRQLSESPSRRSRSSERKSSTSPTSARSRRSRCRSSVSMDREDAPGGKSIRSHKSFEPPKLTQQISGFNNLGSKSQANSTESFSANSTVATKSSKALTTRSAKSSALKITSEAKTFFVEKLSRAIPVISSQSCKRYSQRRSRARSEDRIYQLEDSSTYFSGDDVSDGSVSPSENSFEDEGQYDSEYSDYETDSYRSDDGDYSRKSCDYSRKSCDYSRKSCDLSFVEDDEISGAEDLEESLVSMGEKSRELANLQEENETLRANMVALRADWEAILKRMKSLDDDESDFDGSFISFPDTFDCIDKIETMKSEAIGKLDEKANQRKRKSRAKTGVITNGEKDPASFEVCIEDLLRENERLFHDVVTLSAEREDILEEVRCLSVASDKKNSGLLTDEELAKSHKECMDNIASLLKGIQKLAPSPSHKEKAAAMGNDIMKLVQNIVTQDFENITDPNEKESMLERGSTISFIENSVMENSVMDCNTSVSSSSGSGALPRSDCSLDDESSDHYQVTYIVDDDNSSSDSLFNAAAPSVKHTRPISSAENSRVSSPGLDALEDLSDGSHSGSLSHPRTKTPSVGFHSDSNLSNPLDESNGIVTSEEEGDYDCYDTDDRSRGYHRSFTSTELTDVEDPPCGYRARSTGSGGSSDVDDNAYRHSNRSFISNCSSYFSSIIEENEDEDELSDEYNNDESSLLSTKSDEKNYYSDDSRCESFALSDREEDDHNAEQEPEEEEHKNELIENSHDPTVFSKSARKSEGEDDYHTESTCPSISGSENDTSLSSGSDSTKERKGISITVVHRSSRHESFHSRGSSSSVSFFTVSLSKAQVDAVLEEQLREPMVSQEEDMISISTDSAHHQPNNRSFGKKPKIDNKKKYQGEFNIAGERHGYGIYKSRNGNEYRGEWYCNKREGLGVVKIGNGDIFEGLFKNNVKDGVGVYHYNDGECDLSRYENDVRVGDSLRWSSNRRQAYSISKELGAKKIPLDEAARRAKEMGIVVAY